MKAHRKYRPGMKTAPEGACRVKREELLVGIWQACTHVCDWVLGRVAN